MGCAQDLSIIGEGKRLAQVVHGNVGIVGEDHDLRILAGSDVPKISIMGEDIEVFVEDGAVVDKIEIVGEDNKVTCPEGMVVQYSAIGEDNKLRFYDHGDD